ncbi:MAG: hypothetical protein U5L10_03495 [Candidatus Moranbacteria bacterium]|nr:hypothetical protein [Candidatus Moranbacteria bacterium]
MTSKEAFLKALRTFKTSIPIMAGILLIINLLNPLLRDSYADIFTGNYLLDPLIGALAGSISFGIPVTSYVVGGELLSAGVSLVAITAFMLAWATVGSVMLPLEIKHLGKKFALWRNFISFVFSIVIAVATVLTLNLFNGAA